MNMHLATQTTLNSEQSLQLQRDQLFAFTWRCFKELHRGGTTTFVPNWHVKAMCHALEQVARGECQRLLITVPPRHLKSICAAVAFPAWILGHHPGTKLIVASYGSDLASRHARDTRTVIDSPFYRGLFPQTRLSVAKELELETTQRGFRKAASVTGAITGHGADILIVDDLMKAGDSQSVAERQRAQEFYDQSLFTRLNDKSNGRIIAIQQRLHEDDVAAHLIAKGTFTHLNLQAIAERDEQVPTGPKTYHYRKQGEPLFPQQEPLETLARMRIELGAFAFSAQYQQNPVAPGGNRINWTHWGTYDDPLHIRDYQFRVQSWDTGMSAEPTSDYSACTTWGFIDGVWHLLNVYRSRLDFGGLKKQVLLLKTRYLADKIIIEQAATGLPLIRELIREDRMREVVTGYVPRFDKEVRLNSQIARLESGNFKLPTDAPWLDEFRRECLAFPNGKNDDMVDSLSQFLDYLGTRRGLGLTDRARRR